MKKITVNLPVDVLEEATRLTGKNMTMTLIEELEEIQSRAKRSALRDLCGNFKLDIDLESSRQ